MLPAANTRQMTRLELGIVIVTLGVVAAIAIPRLSRGAEPADAMLAGSLRVLRNALELYAAEHGGTYPPPKLVARALTMYSDESGSIFSPKCDAGRGVKFGPYLRAVPRLPVNCPRKSALGIAETDRPGIGWIYSVNSAGIAEIRANTTSEADARGMPYAAY